MRWFLSLILLVAIATIARAELVPEEVGIVAMSSSSKSRELAEHYARARGIPTSHIVLLEGEAGRSMSRQRWESQCRPAIRAWLDENPRAEKIRCLVTCWDVPLRIARRSANSPAVAGRKRYLDRARVAVVKQFGELLATIDSLAPGDSPPQRAALGEEATAAELAVQLQAALKAAHQRLQKVDGKEEKQQAAAAFERALGAGSGVAGLLQTVIQGQKAENLKPEVARRIELFRGRAAGLAEGIGSLSRLPDTVARDAQILRMLKNTSGLIGALRWIDLQRQQLTANETGGSFDSELSLLLWPDYPLFRWQPNLLHYRFAQAPLDVPPTLMVSRLEAPTFELAGKLVDTAIAVEKTGLRGKVYLDARGMSYKPGVDKPGSYSQYDQSLRELAERLKKHTKLEVILDNEAKLFQQGACADAALYCGWYSLAKYIDAFDWRPGAVGYHLASSEATTLRTPGGKVWCNAMLEDGICATLGPVREPYLSSFPLPDDFFPLLLTGRYTLAEVYYLTKPYNSWAMVLVGDPLYNPFKKNPPLAENDLPERLRAK